MRSIARLAIPLLALVAGLTAAGCSLLPAATEVPVEQLPAGVEVVTPPDQMRLELSNGSVIPVVLHVNGGAGHDVPPGGRADLGMGDIGPPPWSAVVTTAAGRELLRLAVGPGDVVRSNTGGGTSSSGRGVRADLSCGRIDLWSGPPMMGPAPPESFAPGDCDP
jgi:hypothetical protein